MMPKYINNIGNQSTPGIKNVSWRNVPSALDIFYALKLEHL